MEYVKLNKVTHYAGVEQQYDAGLRAYMVGIFRYMALGLLLTGVIAMSVASSPQMMGAIFGTPLAWVVMLAPFGLAMFLSFRITSMSVETAQASFWAYAGLMGLSMASIFLVYTGESVARVFFITASIFGTMSIYGHTTKRDLSQFSSFLMMGLIGVVIASLVNLFLQSSALQFMLSIAGVVVFTGLTAYDTQRLKEMYYQVGGNSEMSAKMSILGALMLYMDFINLALSLLRLLGDRRD